MTVFSVNKPSLVPVHKISTVGPSELMLSNQQREANDERAKEALAAVAQIGDHRQEILDKPLRLLSLSIGLAIRGEQCFRPFRQSIRQKPAPKRMRPEDITLAAKP